ncbi:MAG: hypothetical protein PSV23_02520 [Brevundimonas sp.]|uniref:hypothetical protein n=1 Tax=Brevundimonas sp. TaxID=1871086 RepID=UPI002489F5A0|nr:hypothetical protein [Brevundimonas sp.]MDI1325651.1 hypothetical protein [Brevundimonas sp.]
MNNPVEIARARLVAIEQEAEKLRLFLRSWEEVADYLNSDHDAPATATESVDEAVGERLDAPETRTRAVNPPTRVVVEEAIRVLNERGHPMTRRALHEALWARGVEVRGRDPVKTLGTILWRATNDVVQLDGYGYWPKKAPYARAGYLADLADLLGSTNTQG